MKKPKVESKVGSIIGSEIVRIIDNKMLPKELKPFAGQLKLVSRLANGNFSLNSEFTMLSKKVIISHEIPRDAVEVFNPI